VKGPCDPYTQTQTTEIAIKWSKRPDDCPDFFKAHDIELEWLYDWEEEGWSVYAAEDVETANAIMEDITEILKGKDLTGSGPMSDEHTSKALKSHIKGIFGFCITNGNPAQPAALPTECSGPVPNSCPNNLRALNTIRAPPVWSALPGTVNANPSSAVMVIDTGIRPTHTDFAGNLVPRLTVTGMDRTGGGVGRPQLPVPVSLTALPYNAAWASHGTHVSGTVFARWGNGDSTAVGVVGRALGGNCECGIGLPAQLNNACLINCIRYARQAGNVRVINLSWGGTRSQASSPDVPDQERQAIQEFCNSGGIVVVSAGNGEQATPTSPFIGVNVIRPGVLYYPAAFARDLAATNPTCIIVVANLLPDATTLSQDSNFGATVAVAAPGTDIISVNSADDSTTRPSSGTSMAAPHVAGMATLLFNAFPGATQAQVYNCIVSTATGTVRPNPGTPGQFIAGGLVNLEAAYQCMRANPTCPTIGLPACVDPRSGQPVEGCDTRNKYCRPIPNNNRYVCQYNFRTEGALCRLSDNAATAGFGATSFEEMSAEQIREMGLEAEPSAETSNDADKSSRRLAGASEAQQSGHTNGHTKRNKALTCGQCRSNVCVAASVKWCKEARKHAADTAAAVTASSI